MEEFLATCIDWKSFYFFEFLKNSFTLKIANVSKFVFLQKKKKINLFQNLISFPKIYSCMGLTWMCLEVLTEIYDLV